MVFLPLFLALLSGAAWGFVYVRAVMIGFKHKACAFPFPALALNIAWEAQYCFLGFTLGPEVLDWMDPTMLAQPWVGVLWSIQAWVNMAWLLLDGAILWTHFRFGRGEYRGHVGPRGFIMESVAALIAALLLQIVFYMEFGSFGCAYAAFLQNLVMSLLFIGMLHRRESPRGQSMGIAIGKCVGTLAATTGFTLMLGNRLILLLGTLCAVIDLLYIQLLRRTVWRGRVLGGAIEVR